MIIHKRRYYSELVSENPRLLHLYPGRGRRTMCGRRFLKFTKTITWVHVEDLFNEYALRWDDTVCEACLASEDYKAREALYLLGDLP